MKTTEPPLIAVVGSGVTGLSACLALAQEGYQLILCGGDDPAAACLPDQNQAYGVRVYALNHLSCRLLEKLGVWSTIAAGGRAQAYTSMEVWEKDCGAGIGFHAHEVGETRLGYIVEADLIKAALWEPLKRMPQVEIACPCTVSKIELRDQQPRVQLDQGPCIEPALLLGADGTRSVVARSLGLDVPLQDYRQDAIAALMRTEKEEAASCCYQCFSEHGITAWLPLGSGLGVLIWSCPRDRAKRLLKYTKKQFKAQVNRLLASRLASLQLESEPVSFPLYGRLVKSYTAGYCALLGDAAHTVHPLAGQGANMGLADVNSLSIALRYYKNKKRELPSLAILQHYQGLVKGRNWAMKTGLDFLFRGFSESAQPYKLLRAQGLRLINRCTPVKTWFMRQAMRIE